jgi:hypothetical protein
MKRRNLIFVMLLVFSGLFVIQSCKKESPVAFTEEEAFTIPTLVAPAQGFITVTGATVTLEWASTNAANDPQNWQVFFGPGDDPALIQSTYTSQSITVNVTPGSKYNWKVIGTDSNGMHTRSPIWSFEVIDPNAPLDLKMSWTTDVKTIVGLDLAPDAAANLRMLILKADMITLAVPAISTSSFEDFTTFSTLPDGVYYVAADLSKTINAGDYTKVFDLSINLQLNQRGILTQQLPYPNVMTTANPCPLYRTYLAKVTKTGNTFTAEKAVSYTVPPIVSWTGTDATYPSIVTTTATCASTTMKGLAVPFLQSDFWGEVLQTGGTLVYTISGTTITIAQQTYATTKYLGVTQPTYSIAGTGTINNSGANPVWDIKYDLIQSGTKIAHYLFTSVPSQWPTDYFEAIITSAPGGKGLIINSPVGRIGLVKKPSFK